MTQLRSAQGARLCAARARSFSADAVLVLHGGEEQRTRRCYWWMPQVLLCRWLAVSVARRWRGSERPSVFWLQHSWTGWDGDGRDAVRDLEWALDELRRLRGDRRIVLVGHSMGARTAARAAGRDSVVGLVGLAPWLLPGDPVDQLRGKALDLVFGTRDRTLPEPTSAEFVELAERAGARVTRWRVRGGGHAMLWRWRTWHQVTADLAARELHP